MDQFKTQLAAIKQHSFWAMCLGILGVSLGSWWVSTSKLASERTAQESKIKGGESAVQQVTSTPKHPNDAVIQGMVALNYKYAQEVFKGWQLQYDQQAGVLVWPASFEKTGFRAYVDKMRPIEKIPVDATGKISVKDDMPRSYFLAARPGMMLSNVWFLTSALRPMTPASAFARSASMPSTVLPLEPMNSFGA